MSNKFGNVTYCPPDGDDIENPDVELIRNIVLYENEGYWKQGSGESGIEIQGVNEQLIFFNYQDRGVFIMLSPDYEVPVVSSTNNKVQETLVHHIGGNEFRFPDCCLFPKADAWTIIQNFIVSGMKTEKFQWVELYDLDFEHGF
ncbi:hypothetical protein [Vibrio spartinae]|uniref:DUF4265 domain-containing protein n=1 Tax=Vibrio spartinae TaxID=1918945 RepID=A0A1N6M033_9VIBR|nr:hypothetical protein [Vibrio spartinae]QMV15562.1 hypothetical protein Vspart_02884 [Vibrio spartinae]SIO92808.1 hypothetical protein VSP9026_00429 [Vibrio spartinae]